MYIYIYICIYSRGRPGEESRGHGRQAAAGSAAGEAGCLGSDLRHPHLPPEFCSPPRCWRLPQSWSRLDRLQRLREQARAGVAFNAAFSTRHRAIAHPPAVPCGWLSSEMQAPAGACS